MVKIIKILLAVLFCICLVDMPYGYYQLVRFAALVGFSLLAYQAYVKDNINVVILYVGLALLFQPFFKIALGREIWNFVDVLVGVGLLASLILNKKKHSS